MLEHRLLSLRRVFGAALLVVGILLPSYAVWSLGALADEAALELGVPDDYEIISIDTTNFGFRTDTLAVARIRSTTSDRSSFSAFLREQGFALYRADPEEWIRPRADRYDATIWRIDDLSAESSTGADIAIEVTTFDTNLTDLLPFVLVAGGFFIVGAAAITPRKFAWPVHAGLLAFTAASSLLCAVSLRALAQGKSLIDAHQTAYGPLPTDSRFLAQLGSGGSAAERMLSVRLGTVAGLYPFGYFALLVSIAAMCAGSIPLVESARVRAVIIGLAAASCVSAVVVFGESVGLIVDILE